MASEFKIKRMVEFHETDMAGIMHFANYFHFMEAAEHAFVRSLGLSIAGAGAEPNIGWPRVSVSCDYKRPLKFQDVVEVHLKVANVSEKAITYSFFFRKNGEKELTALGSVTVVCVTFRDGKMQATLIPKSFAEKIEAAQ